MLDRIQESADFIRKQLGIEKSIKTGVILGSGLGDFISVLDRAERISYEDIPHFPISTVEGHDGELILGEIEGKKILALKGRFHYYEGYSLKEATFPVRVFKALGVEQLLISNASGGLNPTQNIGDLMLIEDHIHLFPDNPLRGKNIDELGPRFPDMSDPYEKELREIAHRIAKTNQIDLKEGVYVGTSGPTYETPAEYKYFRIIGADAVGMSTTPETIVAKHASMKVLAVSVISDLGVEGQIVEISHEEVQEVAKEAAPKLATLFKELILQLS
ncbi:MAG: purine-nucleoside phosphorylase [Flavobacteriales bacterium]|nr:purine-nucleoside phosphorylase [Flavobacteriales bacterium]